jgi:hypothetical protein
MLPKNRLYQAFQELGRVIRTVFLLQHIFDLKLRRQITAATNIVESYNGFSKWFFFGGTGIIANIGRVEGINHDRFHVQSLEIGLGGRRLPPVGFANESTPIQANFGSPKCGQFDCQRHG